MDTTQKLMEMFCGPEPCSISGGSLQDVVAEVPASDQHKYMTFTELGLAAPKYQGILKSLPDKQKQYMSSEDMPIHWTIKGPYSNMLPSKDVYYVQGKMCSPLYKQEEMTVVISAEELISSKNFHNFLQDKINACKNQIQESLNHYMFLADPTSSKIGSVLDPPTGGECMGKEGWTQLEATNHSSSALSCMLPLTNYWTEYITTSTVWHKEPESFWKLKSEVSAPPNGSSKHKGTQKDIFKNGIL